MNTSFHAPDQDSVGFFQRALELVSIVLVLATFGFFLYHEQTGSGFFTEN